MAGGHGLPSLEGLESAELRALHTAAFAITRSAGLEALLQTMVDTARELAGARYGALAVVDEEGSIARFLTSGMSGKERDAIGALPGGRGLLGLVLRGDRPVRADDISSHADSSGFPPNHPPMTSYLGVPIVLNDRTVGSLYLTDKRRGMAFDEREERLLVALAAYASLAIEHSSLLRDERLRSEEWRNLFELGREITGALHPEIVLQSIVTRTCKLLGADMALITTLAEDRKHLQTAASDGVESEAMRNLRYRTDQGMAQHILARGSALRVDDYRSDPRLRAPLTSAAEEEGIVSVVGSPLTAQGELLGILYAANRSSRRFSDRDCELLDAFAGLAAIATQHSRLYAQTSDALKKTYVN